MRPVTTLFVFAALGVTMLSTGARAQLGGHSRNIAEFMAGVAPTPVALAEVPAPAREAAEKALGTPNFTDVTEQQYNGDHVYQFRTRDAAGDRHYVIVTGDGLFVSRH